MGMSPTEVDRQSLWQFAAAWNGYVAANTPDKGQLTERQVEELFDWIDASIATRPDLGLPALEWDGRRVSVVRKAA